MSVKMLLISNIEGVLIVTDRLTRALINETIEAFTVYGRSYATLQLLFHCVYNHRDGEHIVTLSLRISSNSVKNEVLQ